MTSGRSSRRGEREAVDALVATLQRALSCVTAAVVMQAVTQPGRPRAIRLSEDPVRLSGAHLLTLTVRYAFDAVSEPGSLRASWTTRVASYAYEVQHAGGQMIFAYHWHLAGVSPITFPHLHLGGTLAGIDLSKAHLPTGSVTLQDVLRFAILDLGVEPLRDDWPQILAHPRPVVA